MPPWITYPPDRCVTYENVYCEFGVLHELVGAREREHFKNVLLRLFETPRGTCPFETKLMYGSDWYVPGSGEQRQVELRAWQATFLHADLIRHYPAFFCGNALRYLDVERRIGVTAAPDAVVVPLHGVVADRLRKVRERFVALGARRG